MFNAAAIRSLIKNYSKKKLPYRLKFPFQQSSAPGGSTPPRSDPRSSPPSSSSDSDEFGNPTTQKIKKISESLQERNCHSPEAKKSQPMPDQIIRLTFRNVRNIIWRIRKRILKMNIKRKFEYDIIDK